MDNWLQKSKENLFKLSNEKNNFKKALGEWKLQSYEIDNTLEEDCGLCNYQGLKYLYYIKNEINQNTMIVGSQCIKKFMAQNLYFYTRDNQKIDIDYLNDTKKQLLKDQMMEIIYNKPFFNKAGQFNDDLKDIVTKAENGDILTIKQFAMFQYMGLSNSEKEDLKIILNQSIFKIKKYSKKMQEQFDELSNKGKAQFLIDVLPEKRLEKYM